MHYTWDILKDGNNIPKYLGHYAVLLLNRPLKLEPLVFSNIWSNASCKVTVDGGTNRFLEFQKKYSVCLSQPDKVTGDFDSIEPKALEYFKNKEDVDVIHTPDQDYTDFNKALNVLVDASRTEELNFIVAIVEHSGRLDQTFSNINILSKVEIPTLLLSSKSLTWLLLPGCHQIYIPSVLREKQEWCAILPFHDGTIKSTGLKWNLDNQKVEFGGLISSSNTYDGSTEVTITTDKTVVWSMSLGDMFISHKSP